MGATFFLDHAGDGQQSGGLRVSHVEGDGCS